MSAEEGSRLKVIGVYITIPFVIGLPPVLGWFIGKWLDQFFGTTPYLMYGLIILGFVAGFRELFRIMNKFGKEL